MNIIIENLETGIRYDEFTCPEEITEAAAHAARRGQTSGLVYGAGDRWQWRVDPEDSIRLEFTFGDEIVYAVDVEKTSWQAFSMVAAKNGSEPRDYLALCIAGCVNGGDSLQEAVGWLFDAGPVRSQVRTLKLPAGANWEDLK